MLESDIILKLPKSLVINLGYREEEVEKELKQVLSVELYREGKISLGRASEIAGFKNKWEMVHLLNRHNTPVNYSSEDLRDDLQTLQELLK